MPHCLDLVTCWLDYDFDLILESIEITFCQLINPYKGLVIHNKKGKWGLVVDWEGYTFQFEGSNNDPSYHLLSVSLVAHEFCYQ
jgi:hypothetical protein